MLIPTDPRRPVAAPGMIRTSKSSKSTAPARPGPARQARIFVTAVRRSSTDPGDGSRSAAPTVRVGQFAHFLVDIVPHPRQPHGRTSPRGDRGHSRTLRQVHAATPHHPVRVPVAADVPRATMVGAAMVTQRDPDRDSTVRVSARIDARPFHGSSPAPAGARRAAARARPTRTSWPGYGWTGAVGPAPAAASQPATRRATAAAAAAEG